MVTYESAAEYVQSKSSIKAKIAAIDQIIDALLTSSLKAATKDHFEEVWLNDGQSQVKIIYNGAEAVQRSIQAFEKTKQLYINKLTGRSVRLIDSKNFTG